MACIIAQSPAEWSALMNTVEWHNQNILSPLTKGGNLFDWLYLAMIHQQLGHEKEAREWMAKAAEDLDRGPPRNRHSRSWSSRLELKMLRAEAEKLLGIQTEKRSNEKQERKSAEDD